jgi:hypothetical protein
MLVDLDRPRRREEGDLSDCPTLAVHFFFFSRVPFCSACHALGLANMRSADLGQELVSFTCWLY